ncbi:MAG: hypothetical protein WC869_01740 [Phycisphaerae bacterium]|jgi:hypothetical protein
MKQLASTIAALAFFVLAITAWCSGLSMLHCAIRASVGALVVYGVVSVAGKVALAILVDAAVRSSTPPGRKDGQ